MSPRRLRIVWLCVLSVATASFVSCVPEPKTHSKALPSPAATLTVAAASDLRAPMQVLAPMFEQQQGFAVQLVFGSSGLLAEQIANGAPYDVFASANREFVDRLVAQGLIDKRTVAVYGYGYLAVVVPADDSRSIAPSLENLRDAAIRRIAIAHPDHAPYGMLARTALTRAGLWETLRPKLVHAENVYSAGQLVSVGEVDASIVALSVAKALPSVRYSVVPTALYTPLAQTLGVVATSPNREGAMRFAAFLLSPQAQAVLRHSGIPAPDDPPLRP
ncbi:MAG: molybdate ABC transporter substrate-binding protein [Thermoflexales bacterium]|nr:molybdate ABC transporter substrate-binding protein [Thermoflexales bacterium]MDW8291768.1 molybdate ABC transporter substrate-binding protein [Anaerolineae bacterium]